MYLFIIYLVIYFFKNCSSLLKQIQKLKESDVNSYINFLKDGIGNLKEEINIIANARLIEEREIIY